MAFRFFNFRKSRPQRFSETHSIVFSPSLLNAIRSNIKLSYSGDVYAFGAMELITSDIIRAQWIVRDLEGHRVTRKEIPKLYKLIEFPNPDFSWSAFIGYVAKDLLSNGNSFIEIASDDSKTEPDLEFYRLIPGNVSIIISKKDYIDHYEYSVNDKVIRIPKENVVFIRIPDPNDELIGLGPLEVAAKEIMLRSWSRVYLSAFFKNGAVPSAIIFTKYPMSDTEYEKLRSKLEGDYSGSQNAFKVLILESNEIEKVDLSTSINEIPIEKLDNNLKQAILSAFRTPDALIGMTQSATKASAVAISTNFWHSVVVPYLTMIRDAINLRLSNFYPDYRLDFDISKVPEIQGYQADVSEKISRLTLSKIITTDEARDIIGLQPGIKNYSLSPLNEKVEEVDENGNNKDK